MSENINFLFDDITISNTNLIDDELNCQNDLTDILNDINNDDTVDSHSNDYLFSEVVDYNINYTVKQLIQICEYYNISKEVRITKCNKEEIINTIVLFENNPINYDIMCRRKQMWFYINELKNDKFMKKFILWN